MGNGMYVGMHLCVHVFTHMSPDLCNIVCDNFGNLKVNEIESLEACYHSKKTSPSTGEIEVQRLMPEYWNHQLKELVNAAFHFNFNRGIYDNIIEENAQDDSPEPPAKRKKKNKTCN